MTFKNIIGLPISIEKNIHGYMVTTFYVDLGAGGMGDTVSVITPGFNPGLNLGTEHSV